MIYLHDNYVNKMKCRVYSRNEFYNVTDKILIQITKKKKDIAINFHTNLFTIQHISNPLCNLFLVKFNPPIYQLHMRTIVEHIITTSLRFKVKGKFFRNSQCQNISFKVIEKNNCNIKEKIFKNSQLYRNFLLSYTWHTLQKILVLEPWRV